MVLHNSSDVAFRKMSFLQVLHQILDVLSKFAKNYDKKLNFSKFASYLKLNPSEVEEIISLLLNFQELYENTFKQYSLRKKIENSHVYLTTEKIQKLINIPIKIRMSQSHINQFNDIIYYFKYVKRGKGFDVQTNGTDLLKNVKELCDYYPYFFQEQKNGLIYPSEFGLKLGELLLSYRKSNKKIEKIKVEETQIIVDNHE
ncbi:unnamed protein product [marine sediment metagenome]|uniref:Uncharacterized protein n=1 Tax=marine sediment metagenome TaxID=412755 RepID=X1JR11_9ZZZZ